MSADNTVIFQPALATQLVYSGRVSPTLAETGADPEAFLQALLQQFQAFDVPVGVSSLPLAVSPADQQGDGNSPDEAGNLLPDIEASKEQLEERTLMPEQLAQFLAQFVPQQGQVPVATNADSACVGEAAMTGSAMKEQLGEQPLTPEQLARLLAQFTPQQTQAPLEAELESRNLPAGPTPLADKADSVGSGVMVAPESLRAALNSVQAKSAGDGPEFSTSQETTGAPVDLPNSDEVSPEMKVVPPEIPAMHRQPDAAPAKEVAPPMDKPVGQVGWSQELGERVVWMRGKGLQAAELRLNPAHLGPLEVRIDLDRDQASIQFVSQHAAVREAIESAIPKLREMLGAQQLNLTEVNVSQQSFTGQSDQGNARFASDRQSGAARQGFEGQVPESEPALPQAGKGLLNLYA